MIDRIDLEKVHRIEFIWILSYLYIQIIHKLYVYI